jgi:hypothetical protein
MTAYPMGQLACNTLPYKFAAARDAHQYGKVIANEATTGGAPEVLDFNQSGTL